MTKSPKNRILPGLTFELKYFKLYLQPSNILVKSKRENGVKISYTIIIADFIQNSANDGSKNWSSPEVLRRERGLCNKLDIFSLGCVFHYILTDGKHPFGDGGGATEDRIKNGIHKIDTNNLITEQLIGVV